MMSNTAIRQYIAIHSKAICNTVLTHLVASLEGAYIRKVFILDGFVVTGIYNNSLVDPRNLYFVKTL